MINTIINKLKNSYAKEFELTEEEINSLSREEAVKILDWIISSVKLECSKEKAADIFERVGYDLEVEFYEDDAVALYTYPESNDFFCKKFEVEKGWLLNTLIDIDKLNAREGVELSNFLQNYEYGETQLVYQKAKKESNLKSEVELKITKDIIRQGLSSGYIKLINCPQSTAETVCQINNNWFYFGGQTAEGVLPEEYKKIVPFESIVDDIFNTLEAFRKTDWVEEFHDEYAMYESYLRSIYESQIFVVETLKKEGMDYYHHPNSLSYEFGYGINQPTILCKILDGVSNCGFITMDTIGVSRDEFIETIKNIKEKKGNFESSVGTDGSDSEPKKQIQLKPVSEARMPLNGLSKNSVAFLERAADNAVSVPLEASRITQKVHNNVETLGYLVYPFKFDNDIASEIPADLQEIIEAAIKNDVVTIIFDRDE